MASLNLVKSLYRIGNLSCKSQVDAVGRTWLSRRKTSEGVTSPNPHGGTLSAPEKKIKTSSREQPATSSLSSDSTHKYKNKKNQDIN